MQSCNELPSISRKSTVMSPTVNPRSHALELRNRAHHTTPCQVACIRASILSIDTITPPPHHGYLAWIRTVEPTPDVYLPCRLPSDCCIWEDEIVLLHFAAMIFSDLTLSSGGLEYTSSASSEERAVTALPNVRYGPSVIPAREY